MSAAGSGVFSGSINGLRHGEDSAFAPTLQDVRLELIEIMHGKNYVVSLDELVEHFFQGSASQSKKAIPNLFAKVPHFKTERAMYDHFVSSTPTNPLCP